LRTEGFKYQSHWKQRERLPWDTSFVAKIATHSFGQEVDTCEAGALTTEPTAQNQSYFSPKTQLCKTGALSML
jgi:hypothetical protein